MTFLLLSIAALAAFAAVVLSWLFRSTSAPLWQKITGPSVAIIAACSLYFNVNSLLGLPVTASMADMPDNVELVAFVPHDETKIVALWLIVPPSEEPRAYETVLDEGMKQTLREAREQMAEGKQVMLSKHGGKPGKAKESGDSEGEGHANARGDRLGIGQDDMHYTLDINAFSQLPPKN